MFFGAAEDVNEPTLLELFSKHGDVKGLFLVRSALGLPSGCGYVTMATAEQAKAAAHALHGTTECAEEGGRLGLLIVGHAEHNNKSAADNVSYLVDNSNGASSSVRDSKTVSRERCLHPAHAPRQSCCNSSLSNTAVQLTVFFARGSSLFNGAKYSPFCNVDYASSLARSSCLNPGFPLPCMQIFFTKVPPTVTAQQLIQLFTSCGDVIHVELFTPWPGAKISKGCGLVEFAHVDAAAAAVNSLHQAFTWPHSHSPLVVEWVDSKRQQANRANKLSKAAAAAAVAASDRTMHRTLTVPMDKQLSSGSVYGSGAGLLNGSTALQQQNSLSAPLPQLQQAWAQQPTMWSPQTGYLLPQQQLASMSAGMVEAEWLLRQQQQNAVNSTYPTALRHSISGTSSLMSGVDRSASLATTITSTISNGSTVFNMTPNDFSNNSLACPASTPIVPAGANSSELYSNLMLRSPNRSEVGIGKAAAMGLGASNLDPVWQQLQQQNVMMLQPLSSTAEEQISGSALLLPNGSSALATEYQNASLGSMLGTSQNMLKAGNLSALYSNASGLATPEVDLFLQQQQIQMRTPPLMGAASSRPPLQPQQQQWWNQQPAQLHKDEASVIIVPLTLRQLQVMSSILPEVPKLTGAQACLTPGSVDGSVQLMLSGRMSEVQSGHSVVSMLLTQLGIEDPLMPAMAQRI